MTLIRQALSFVFWVLVGWLWLLVASVIVGGVVAFTVNEFLLDRSTPAVVGYLASGLAAFAAATLALFSTAHMRRLGRGVLVAALVSGIVDVVLSLSARAGVDVPHVGYSFILAGRSFGAGAQLVNGVGILAASGVFLFSRYLSAGEERAGGPEDEDLSQFADGPTAGRT